MSREEGEALWARLADTTRTAADRHTRGKSVPCSCWVLFAFREAQRSLRRVRVLVFGAPKKPEKPSSPDETGSGGGTGGPSGTEPASQQQSASEPAAGKPRQGHGRQSAEGYRGAPQIACPQEALAVGERCPACGRGRRYR